MNREDIIQELQYGHHFPLNVVHSMLENFPGNLDNIDNPLALIQSRTQKRQRTVYSTLAFYLWGLQYYSANDAKQSIIKDINEIANKWLPNSNEDGLHTKVNISKSTPNKIVLDCIWGIYKSPEFEDNPIYFQIIVTPSLEYGIQLSLKGTSKWPRRKSISIYRLKDYLLSCYEQVLTLHPFKKGGI